MELKLKFFLKHIDSKDKDKILKWQQKNVLNHFF